MGRELGDGYHINHEMWGIANLHQYFFQSGDRTTLERTYPGFARSIRTIYSNASPYGLVGSCFGGADYSPQAGRPQFPDDEDNRTLTSRLSGVEDMGVFYSGLTQGAELAALLGDTETVEMCADVCDRLQRNFLKLYLDPDTGYLVDCVWFKDNPVNKNIFHRMTALLALCGWGELLMLDAIDSIATFVSGHMRHPVIGLCDAPGEFRTKPVYERWNHHWLQNASKESMKLARMAGDQELLLLQCNMFLKHFDADKLIHEDLYYAFNGGKYKPENLYQSTSWWQCMTAYAWWNGMIESIAGLRSERGQVEYVPGDPGMDVALSNFNWGSRRWALNVSGRGRWIKSMTVNGLPRLGTCQILAAGDDPDQSIAITKTADAPAHPVILSAGSCPVTVTSLAPDRLEAVVQSAGFVRLHLFSPKKPVVTADGANVAVRWSQRRREGVLSIVKRGAIRLVVDCA